MSPFTIFFAGLFHNPKSALEGLYWYVRRYRVRGWNKMYAAAMENPDYYRLWIRYSEPSFVAEAALGEVAELRSPIIPLILDNGGDCDATTTSIASMTVAFRNVPALFSATADGGFTEWHTKKRYSSLEAAVTAAAKIAPEGWLLPIMSGDRIAPWSGALIARALRQISDQNVIYWDEDRLEGSSRHTPFLKPDWDSLLYLARDYISGSAMLRMASINDIDPKTAPSTMIAELFLTALVNDTRQNPFHIPMVLAHRTSRSNFALLEQRIAMIERLWPEPVDVEINNLFSGSLTVHFPMQRDPPSVSIIIPTREGVDLLKTCIAGLQRVDYPGVLEIIVVDNESAEPATLSYLAELDRQGMKVVRHTGAFNFSKINNHAVAQSSGKIVCLLNNDIEMLDGGWLSRMVAHAVRSDTGAVGALLLYPDRSVQHAGVAIGIGNAAGHVHRKLPLDQPGHQNLHRTTRQVSAVTAACLVLRREAFDQVGGLDEVQFAVAFNDVDLCLKLDAKGLKNIFVAEAMLIHHESKSRGSDMAPEQIERYRGELAALQKKWLTETIVDRHHHPLWRRSSEVCVLEPTA